MLLSILISIDWLFDWLKKDPGSEDTVGTVQELFDGNSRWTLTGGAGRQALLRQNFGVGVVVVGGLLSFFFSTVSSKVGMGWDGMGCGSNVVCWFGLVWFGLWCRVFGRWLILHYVYDTCIVPCTHACMMCTREAKCADSFFSLLGS